MGRDQSNPIVHDHSARVRSHLLKISGQRLMFAYQGSTLRLKLNECGDILSETAIYLSIPGQRPLTAEPASCSELLHKIVGKRLVASGTSPAGELSLMFDSGEELMIPPCTDREAWAVITAYGLLISLAGGEIAIWDQML